MNMNPIRVEVGNVTIPTAEKADPNCSAYVILSSMQALGYTVDAIRYDTDQKTWIVYTKKGPFF